jgi:hypothetical protein
MKKRLANLKVLPYTLGALFHTATVRYHHLSLKDVHQNPKVKKLPTFLTSYF